MFEHPDDAGFTYSTDTEWDMADAYQQGVLYPERAWVCTDRDVWHKNPFYKGPPQPHPEDDHAWEAIQAGHAYEEPVAWCQPKTLDINDDMPF